VWTFTRVPERSVVMIWAVLPFAAKAVGVSLNVGVVYVVAVGGLGTLAIMLAGMSSNNKYALLGAFRTVAQLVSYEAPMIIALLVPVMLAGSMNMDEIVNGQSRVWFVVMAPVPFLVFFMSSIAEVGRTPFDLLEAESEIVAGFHIEYSGMKFGMFFVAEFLHAFTVGALTAVLFLGGWRGPGAETYPLLGVVYFAIKAFAGYFLVILMRATLPRIRIDHMLDLNWKFLTPLALGAIVFVAVADKAIEPWLATLQPEAAPWARGGVLLLANLLLVFVTYLLLSGSARRIRRAEEAAASAGHPDERGASGGGEAGHHDEHHADAHAAPAHGEAHAAPAH
jgi:NADH-quinone oxidoreductase subunit H